MERSTKSLWRAFRREGGQGAMRLQATTWLSEMKVEADATLVDGQRKEETFQVDWMMFLLDR